MKFNTNDYKLSLFTENVCEDCSKLKDILKNNNISFSDKSITKGTETNNNNRWDFIDAERENNGFNWFTPVLIIEDSEGNEIVKERDFWFAWYAFHPETEVHKAQ